jgi:hypothetical protein
MINFQKDQPFMHSCSTSELHNLHILCSTSNLLYRPLSISRLQLLFNSNEWKQIYILPFKATACTKLNWFQFRINLNILATNYFLKKNCNFCQKENETIELNFVHAVALKGSI